ncbi:MAG: LuxR C-terminal-related transcriptional regulator [Pseudonocardia sp.]|nr:LuxR C-terminal-related transcriptional regulator [Pseudonocardia sp.]
MTPARSVPTDPLAGMPAAARFVRRVTADPAAPLVVTVVGPGGSGKSSLLDAVASAYRDTGVVPVRLHGGQDPSGFDADPDQVLLVDDAHRLDPQAAERLRVLARAACARLVVTCRPWPLPRVLVAAGPTARPPAAVVLGHLDRAAVGVRVADRLAGPAPADLVDLVFEQSGGLPRLVDIVTQALVDSGRFDPHRPDQFRRPERIAVSATLAERLRNDVDVLDAAVRRLLEAMAVGTPCESEVLAPMADATPADLVALVEAARATGLLTDAGELVPFARSMLLRLTPLLRIQDLQRRLAGIQLDRGGSVLDAGRRLLGTGAGGTRVAAILTAAADEAIRRDPDVAGALFDAAVDAGTPVPAIAVRRARAAALAGDLDTALRLTDEVIARQDAPDRQDAIVIAAAALAGRGLLSRSAELYRSLPRGAEAAVLAVPALIGTGDLEQARAVLAAAPERTTGLLGGAATMLANGVLESVTGSPLAAVSRLVRATAMLHPVAATTLLPDTPAVLAALVSLHAGEFAIADDSLHRAASGRHGGIAAQPRLMLLHSWLCMLRGRFSDARRALAHATAPSRTREARDELFAVALSAGLARRDGDEVALAAAWGRARTALVHQPVDLFVLLPLGELVVAAARLGEHEWMAVALEDAHRLLNELGDPPLWAAPLHWYELHAAIERDRHADVERHAAALALPGNAQRRGGHPVAAAYAAAATAWLQTTRGEIDPADVRDAAQLLHDVGLRWDAAHLAGQAAHRVNDRRETAALHACARALLPAGSDIEVPSQRAARSEIIPAEPDRMLAEAEDATGSGVGMSERELEIGQLILAGLTYKQIGEKLFVSAKTVEHHVARMRRRLGASSRTELFGRLRDLPDPDRTHAG